LRYFFGGMNLLGEMVFLALIFMTSMALTAVMVGLSGTATKLIRALLILGFIVGIQAVPAIVFSHGFSEFMNVCSLPDWPSRIRIFLYVSFIAYYGWCALSQGISAIAPAAENHSTPRRVVGLLLTLITAAVGFFGGVETRVLPFVFAIILIPAVIIALTERSVMLPPIYKPFLQRGMPGKIAGIFLLPGWPSGVFFTALVTVIGIVSIMAATYFNADARFEKELAIGGLSVLGAILLPALFAANFTKQGSKRFTIFLLFLVVSVLLMAVPAILASINHYEKVLWLFIWDPLIFLTMMDTSAFDKGDLLLAVSIVDFVLFALLMGSAGLAFRAYGDVFRETRDGLLGNTDAICPPAES
ncbi:MAG: hypothetical protein ABI162_16375, partial [Luteolibacter sp.]